MPQLQIAVQGPVVKHVAMLLCNGWPTRADVVISNGNLKTGSKKGTIKANITEDSGAYK